MSQHTHNSLYLVFSKNTKGKTKSRGLWLISHLNKCTTDWDKCTECVCFNHCVVTQLNKHTCTIQCLIECSKYIYFSDCTIAYSSKDTEFTLVELKFCTHTQVLNLLLTLIDRKYPCIFKDWNEVCFISQNLLLIYFHKFEIWLLAF